MFLLLLCSYGCCFSLLGHALPVCITRAQIHVCRLAADASYCTVCSTRPRIPRARLRSGVPALCDLTVQVIAVYRAPAAAFNASRPLRIVVVCGPHALYCGTDSQQRVVVNRADPSIVFHSLVGVLNDTSTTGGSCAPFRFSSDNWNRRAPRERCRLLLLLSFIAPLCVVTMCRHVRRLWRLCVPRERCGMSLVGPVPHASVRPLTAMPSRASHQSGLFVCYCFTTHARRA